jgi:hypothetical protein
MVRLPRGIRSAALAGHPPLRVLGGLVRHHVYRRATRHGFAVDVGEGRGRHRQRGTVRQEGRQVSGAQTSGSCAEDPRSLRRCEAGGGDLPGARPSRTLAGRPQGGGTVSRSRNTVPARWSVLPGQAAFLGLVSQALRYRIFPPDLRDTVPVFALFPLIYQHRDKERYRGTADLRVTARVHARAHAHVELLRKPRYSRYLGKFSQVRGQKRGFDPRYPKRYRARRRTPGEHPERVSDLRLYLPAGQRCGVPDLASKKRYAAGTGAGRVWLRSAAELVHLDGGGAVPVIASSDPCRAARGSERGGR